MNTHSRREVMKTMGFAAIAAGANWKVPLLLASPAPTAPVAVSRCKTYNSAELLSTLGKMFDQLGGLSVLSAAKPWPSKSIARAHQTTASVTCHWAIHTTQARKC